MGLAIKGGKSTTADAAIIKLVPPFATVYCIKNFMQAQKATEGLTVLQRRSLNVVHKNRYSIDITTIATENSLSGRENFKHFGKKIQARLYISLSKTQPNYVVNEIGL